MSRRGLWLPLIAVACLFGIAATSPASGRGSGAGSGFAGHGSRASFHSRIATAHIILRSNGVVVGRGRFGLAQPLANLSAGIGIASYPWFFGTGSGVIASEAIPDPYVIVVSQPYPVPVRTPPAPQSDVAVGGCHAIPNGYHCDVPDSGPAR